VEICAKIYGVIKKYSAPFAIPSPKKSNSRKLKFLAIIVGKKCDISGFCDYSSTSAHSSAAGSSKKVSFKGISTAMIDALRSGSDSSIAERRHFPKHLILI
jgi:hypothetical protein